MKVIFRNTNDRSVYVPIRLAALLEGAAAEQDGANEIVVSLTVRPDDNWWERRNCVIPKGVEVEVQEETSSPSRVVFVPEAELLMAIRAIVQQEIAARS